MDKNIKIIYTILMVFIIALVLALLADHTLFKTYYSTVIYERKISI